MRQRRTGPRDVQLNVRLNRPVRNLDEVTLYVDPSPPGTAGGPSGAAGLDAEWMRRAFGDGILLEADGVEDAVWIPPGEIRRVRVVGTAPQKPRDDRHDDY